MLSSAANWQSQGQAPSCYSGPRVWGTHTQLVFALRLHLQNPMQQQALQLLRCLHPTSVTLLPLTGLEGHCCCSVLATKTYFRPHSNLF
jgi:hypothetical protein